MVLYKNKQDDPHFHGQMAVFSLERLRVRFGISSNCIFGDQSCGQFCFKHEQSHAVWVVASHIHLLFSHPCHDERQEFVSPKNIYVYTKNCKSYDLERT